MKKIINIFLVLFCVVFTSCEENGEDPLAGIPSTDLFVEFAADTPDAIEATEIIDGEDLDEDTINIVLNSPISYESDILFNLSFSGSAVFNTDYRVFVEDDNTMIESIDANGAVIRAEAVPTAGDVLVTEQARFSITFPEDLTEDGEKELEITLTGATVDLTGQTLAGGRGPLRRQTVVVIADSDAPDPAD